MLIPAKLSRHHRLEAESADTVGMFAEGQFKSPLLYGTGCVKLPCELTQSAYPPKFRQT